MTNRPLTLQRITRATLAGLLLGTHCVPSAAATKTIVLTERLGKKWSNELVSYPFSAAKGEATANSISVTAANQPVAAQLSDVELWPGSTSVKSARLLFLVPALEPGAANSYTVSYGSAPATSPVTDLKVTPGDGWVELSTARFAARLLTGEKTYPAPAPAGEVPGPLNAMRLAGGAWDGGSKLYGDLGVKAWSAKLVETGPVRAHVQCRYTLADDTTATFDAELIAGDDKLLSDMDISRDRPTAGVNFQLAKLPGVTQAVVPKTWGQWGRPRTIAVKAAAEPVASLSPNSSIVNSFPDGGSTMIFKSGESPGLRLVSRDPGAWTQPAKPFTYGGYEKWNLDMIPLAWEGWKRKRMPVSYATDGALSLQASFASGRRSWSIGGGDPASGPTVGEELDGVKDLVLDWPEGKQRHPYLWMAQADIDAAWKRNLPGKVNPATIPANGINGAAVAGYLASGADPELTKSKVLPQLRSQLGLLGDYDTMRYGIAATGLYDALIDTSFVAPDERKLLRAQMACLGYRMADPMMWSIERGYHSGNPNMSISYTLTLGIIACAIPDHPMAKTWSTYATTWMDKWLTDEVGANGEWIPEGSHYGITSLVPLVTYAVTARRAGFHDFLGDPRFKKLMLFFGRQTTPPDPQWRDVRVSPSVGRGTSGDANAVYGVLARATATTDPAFSQTMQWTWAQGNYPTDIGDWRLGGFEVMYMDRTLPAKKPDWSSESFPELGALFRDGVGTPSENYVNVLAFANSTRNLDIWTPEIGNIASWYAYGKPLSKQFSFAIGYNERHELLRGGVALAHNWGAPGDSKTPFGYYTKVASPAFATLPRLDYTTATYDVTKVDDRDWFPADMPAWPRVKAATAPTLNWTRQTMFLKDEQPNGPHYLLLRDATAGGQPTTWQFWTLSEKIGTPDQVKDAAGFLADKPGNKILPARELPVGDRYTSLGQFGVDLEYYIAGPTGTPRSTLRYGGSYRNVPEYQDVLHLQQPGDGTYFVALFPRARAEAAPAFSTLGAGKIIKVAGAFGTDYGFLSDSVGSSAAEGASFEGTAAAVQVRAGQNVLSLAAPGKVAYQQYALASPVASSLRVEPKSVKVNIAGEAKSLKLTLGLPGKWRLAKKVAGAELKPLAAGQYQLTLAAGTTSLQLAAE